MTVSAEQTEKPSGCPVHAAPQAKGAPNDVRKVGRRGGPGAPAIERQGEVWHVRSYEHVRAILRSADATRQAGFNAESVGSMRMRQPVLFQDGPEHKLYRTAVARFFTPKTVSERYRAMMEALSDELIDELKQRGRADLSELSLRLAVQVAAQVVGLTNSKGMEGRLEAFFGTQRNEGLSRPARALNSLRSQLRLLRFYLFDVRPAIAARRKAPQEDVVSHLLEKGYKEAEILSECVTYAAAGMATTREFISMAAWHLLEDDDLRRTYVEGDESTRQRVLSELLRLEPVVGHLYRRAVQEIVLEDAGRRVTVPAGALLDLYLHAANTDPEAVGERPLSACPARELAPGVQPPVMSFGDGAHRCPGAFIALQESDIFLRRLLALPVRLARPPKLTYNNLIESYELRGLELVLDGAR